MIRKISEDDNKILEYIGDNYNESLYLYLDYLKYGISNANIQMWKQIIGNNYSALILKYYSGMHIFSKDKDLLYEEIVDLVKLEKPTIICAEKEIISNLAERLNDYESEYGWIRELSNIGEEYQNNEVITKITEEDYNKIVTLLMNDEMGEAYTFDNLYNQLEQRNIENYGRNYIIKDGDTIISHAATGAEMENIAVLCYVITNPDYRCRGYSEKVVGKLCYDLIEEGKKVYLVNYSDESTKLYDKLGFEVSANIGKLVLKK